MEVRRGALSSASRARLKEIVTARLGAADTSPPPSSHRNQATDFTTLPGYRDILVHRAAAAALQAENPFFRVHEGRAGPTTVVGGRVYDNYSSYDYLGLNGHPAVIAAAKTAIDHYGVSPSASRIVAGERPIHAALERGLAIHYGQDDAVTFVSGHATNVSAIASLMGPRDLILHDAAAHNSIVMGATLARAERRSFPHNDVAALEAMLATLRPQFERVLIVVEGLYSMDGDAPDLGALIAIKQRHAAWLMVDDAHGLGVLGATGAGIFEHCGIDPKLVDIWMGTLSKTLASCGGYLAGCTPLIDYVRCTSGGFIYSVGLPPALAAAALAALDMLHAEPDRVMRLRRNGALFTSLARDAGLDVGTSLGAAVIPVITADSILAVLLSQRLFEKGVNVQPIIHPAVPERAARLRFFISSAHEEAQIRRVVDLLAEHWRSFAGGHVPIANGGSGLPLSAEAAGA